MTRLTVSIAVVLFIALCVVAVRPCDPPATRILAAGVAGPSLAATPTRVTVERGPVTFMPRHGRSAPRRTLNTTAYCSTGNRTASGVWPQVGMAASNLYPFGTRLRVPGVGLVVITDRIGYGSELDIYMGADGCEQRALIFGRRTLAVTVLP